MVEWSADDRAVLSALSGHWRKSAGVGQLTLFAIPDEATRRAALLVGQVDIADIDLASIPSLLSAGFATTESNGGRESEINLVFAGNYWEEFHAITGDPLDRPGFDPNLPWVGDPDNASSMESARLVRQALSMAYDREAIDETVLGGLGWAHSVGGINPMMPEYRPALDIPFDPAAAASFLTDAGYPDGFAIELFAVSTFSQEFQESGAQIAQAWTDLGLDVTLSSFEYAAFRPSLVSRSNSTPWLTWTCPSADLLRRWDWPDRRQMSSLTRGGFGCGVEDPFFAQSYMAMLAEPDLTIRLQMADEVADYLRMRMLVPGVVTIPQLMVYNPSTVVSWATRPSSGSAITATEKISPSNRMQSSDSTPVTLVN